MIINTLNFSFSTYMLSKLVSYIKNIINFFITIVKNLLGYSSTLPTIEKDINNNKIKTPSIEEGGKTQLISSNSKNKNNNKTLLIIEDDWYRSHANYLENLVASNNLDILTFEVDENHKDEPKYIDKIIRKMEAQPQKEYNNIAIFAHGSYDNNKGIHGFIAFDERISSNKRPSYTVKTSIEVIKKLKEVTNAKNVILSSCYAGSDVANKYKQDVIKDSDESITVIGEDKKQVVIENALIGLRTLLNSKTENNGIFKLDVDVAKKITKNSGLNISFIKGAEKINTSIDRKMILFTKMLSSLGIIDKKADGIVALYNAKAPNRNDLFMNQLYEDIEILQPRNIEQNIDSLVNTLENEDDNERKELNMLDDIIKIYSVAQNSKSMIEYCITNSYKDGKLDKEEWCDRLLTSLTTDGDITQNAKESLNSASAKLVKNLNEINEETRDPQAILAKLFTGIGEKETEVVNSIIQNKRNNHELIGQSPGQLIDQLPKQVYIKCIHKNNDQTSENSEEENVDNMDITSILAYIFFQSNLPRNLKSISNNVMDIIDINVKSKLIEQRNTIPQLAIEWTRVLDSQKNNQLKP